MALQLQCENCTQPIKSTIFTHFNFQTQPISHQTITSSISSFKPTSLISITKESL
ncbi:hypothetical protein Pint_18336 [Pistacia integerrima]|uniref:Uncharacterized protein n=1 Tax=Pistacia integerrima TaxID=434235 RepID=A0ACC0YWS0_9ROSI|nr:hypothetical protein Pint_18336 [Pistacia integerrima]